MEHLRVRVLVGPLDTQIEIRGRLPGNQSRISNKRVSRCARLAQPDRPFTWRVDATLLRIPPNVDPASQVPSPRSIRCGHRQDDIGSASQAIDISPRRITEQPAVFAI